MLDGSTENRPQGQCTFSANWVDGAPRKPISAGRSLWSCHFLDKKGLCWRCPLPAEDKTSAPSPRFAPTYRCESAFFRQWVQWRTNTAAGSLVNTHISVSFWTSHSWSPRKTLSLLLPLKEKCCYKIKCWQEIDFQCTVELTYCLMHSSYIHDVVEIWHQTSNPVSRRLEFPT